MQKSLLGDLPSELLLHLLSFLSLPSLLSLSRTDKSFHRLIQTTVLPRFAYNRLHYSPATLKHTHSRWTWGRKASWADAIAQQWKRWEFSGVRFGRWERAMPMIRIWALERDGAEGVLIARGKGLEWWVAMDGFGTMECVKVVVQGYEEFNRSGYGRQQRATALDDITALAEGGRPGEIIVSRVSGVVQRLRVVDFGGGGTPIVLGEISRYLIPEADLGRPGSTAVQALHSSTGSNLVVSASTTRLRPPNPSLLALDENDSLAHTLMKRAAPKRHQVAVHSVISPWQPPSTLPLSAKPWSVHLAPTSTPSWLAIGQSGTSPLSLVQLDSNGCPIPSSSIPLATTSKPTSVYSLTTPSLACSPFLRPDQTLIAAFFDSTTRIYDLRVPPPASTSSSALTTTTSNWNDDLSSSSSSLSSTNEVLRLSDPWSDDPSYSVACGGALGAYVAVGSARNSAVRIFDVRSPFSPFDSNDDEERDTTTTTTRRRKGEQTREGPRGITAFGPKGDRSPVYGLQMENSRIWGVTDSGGFVFNFHANDRRPGGGGRRRSTREESIAFVAHEGKGKGKLRRTGDFSWVGDTE